MAPNAPKRNASTTRMSLELDLVYRFGDLFNSFSLKESYLTRLFPNNLARALVFPDTEKHRLTKAVVARPLCEFDLADHFRLHPTTTFHVGSG
jgi:hypothetical protein